jgi:hypothetical protein
MLKRQIALLAAALLCLVAAPASATHHKGKGKGSEHDSVLLEQKSSGRGAAAQVALLRSIRLDLRDFGRHDNGLHLGHLKKKLKDPKGPKLPAGGGIPGGGAVVKPPTHGDGVPMPEPTAALLFALGTGMVALRLRARR